MKTLVTLGLLAGAGYVGWQLFADRARSTVTSYVTGAADTMSAWNRYVASEAYRMSPPSMRLTRQQFARIWEGLPPDVRAQLNRSYTMTQQQMATEMATNPQFASAMAAAAAAWRGSGTSGVPGIGNYYRSRGR